MTTDVSTNKLKINILTRTQYDSATKNDDELYFIEESETNTWLIAVTDIAPLTASINDRYYNSNTKLIYTWDGTTWTNSISPSSDDLYINKTDNSTYAWDGENLIQVGSSGGITPDDIDDETITLNSSDKLQASGVINKNDGTAKYDWVGTKEEYDLLDEIHNDWIYYITDDEYPSGNMSLSNVYNRLNRAYAWTNRSVSGAGNVYNVGYYNGSFFVSEAFPAIDVVEPSGTNNSDSIMPYHMICDGKMYYVYPSSNTFTITQVGTDTTWSFLASGCWGSYDIGINNGDLYTIHGTATTLKDSGGWQKISCAPTYHNAYKALGIKNDSLYLLTGNLNIALIDSSGVWTSVEGFLNNNDTSGYMFGIKNGKLYSISYTGVVTEISSDDKWQSIYGNELNSNYIYYGALGINDGALYKLKNSGITLIDDTETWVKCTGKLYPNLYSFGITNTGKLYKISINTSGNITLTQVGTDTTWTDITGYNNNTFGINNGNVYYNLTSTPTQLTTIGGITKIFGNRYGTDVSYQRISYWTGSVTENAHTVYTVPSPQTGFHTYADENLTNVSTITAVNMNNNTITDGLYTYTRDSAADKVFTNISPDSKNQLISMADLLNAIKG